MGRALKARMDQIRTEFAEFIRAEEVLRDQRHSEAKTATWTLLSLIALLGILIGGGIAYAGRRQLLKISGSYSEVLKKSGGEERRVARPSVGEKRPNGTQCELSG